jgi:hypothetical protein
MPDQDGQSGQQGNRPHRHDRSADSGDAVLLIFVFLKRAPLEGIS